MKRAICTVILNAALVALALPVIAQESFDFPVEVSAGDQFFVEYVHRKNRDGQETSGRITGVINVEEVRGDEFMASWTTRSVTVGDYVIDSNTPQAGDHMLGVPVRYAAGSDGEPLRIIDKEQLLERILSIPYFESQPQDATASVMALLNSMSEEALADALLKAPAIMSMCQGTNLQPGVRNRSRMQFPSPFGGSALDANVSYLLRKVDPDTGVAKIEVRIKLDPESATRATKELMERFSAGSDSEPEMQDIMVEKEDSANCDVSTETGWTTTVIYITEMEVAGTYASEIYEIWVDHRR